MEGGMDEISNMLHKVRTLAVLSANGTNTQDNRVALSKEAKSLADEISRIAKQTKYGESRSLMLLAQQLFLVLLLLLFSTVRRLMLAV